ncbi:MAG: protein kinase domain-containing protein [Phycisphaerales bacterium]
MTRERWARVKAVFEVALAVPEMERAAAVTREAGDDAALAAEVESLLAHHGRATGFMEVGRLATLTGGASARPVSTQATPKAIGGYAIERELGRGGMGVVYLARDPVLDRPVAIKVLSEAMSRDAEGLMRFEREARILAALNHPNIAAIHSLGTDDGGSRFLVLEYAEGKSLGERLGEGAMTVAEAAGVLAQVARAVEAAHDRGVIHRDLKPDNIRVSADGLVKVLDFGLARRWATTDHPSTTTLDSSAALLATTPGLIMGTPGYMSPEQARGQEVDKRTDIFALGCVAYACLTGRGPFSKGSIGDSVAAVLSEEADWSRLPTQLPAGLRAVLERCLAKDPERRLRDAGEVRREAEAAIGGGRSTGGFAGPSLFVQASRLPAPAPTNLPRQMTSFVGRHAEIDRVREMLGSAALLTLSGAGGCGKTRLALRIGELMAGAFTGGVWLVEVAGVMDSSLVAAAAAAALGVKEQAGRPVVQSLVDRLETKSALLILDNCEHLLAACGELVGTLLRACPDLRIIATSREPLGVVGEATYRVPSLAVPPARHEPGAAVERFEAVELFVERARAARPGFEVTPETAATIAEVCRRLDGIPLAIELAAARIRVLSPEQIHAKLHDRFRLLIGGSRTALERHQTLRAAIDWSYDLLPEDERQVLRTLSVFAGGSTLESAGAVCAVDEFGLLDALTHLADKSLVMVDDHGEHPRYRMLETVRQYAREKLQSASSAEVESACEKHLDYFCSLVERAEPELFGPQQQAWLKRLHDEHDNCLAALDWCAACGDAGHHEKALRVCGALARFWNLRGHLAVGRSAVGRAMAAVTDRTARASLAKSLNAAGGLACVAGDYAEAREHWTATLEMQRALGNSRGEAGALNNLGLVAENRGDYSAARTLYERALEINRGLGNKSWEAINLNNLGNVAWNMRDNATARQMYSAALALNRELGNRSDEARNLNNLGTVAREDGQAGEARALFREAIKIKQELGDRQGLAVSFGQLALAAIDAGDRAGARKLIAEALTIRRDIPDQLGLAMSLAEAAGLAVAEGAWALAATWFAASERLRHRLGVPLALGERARYERDLSALRRALDEAAFNAAWSAGIAAPTARATEQAGAWLAKGPTAEA